MMMKEPEIKLFGRKIIFAGGEISGESSAESNNGSGGGTDCDPCSEVSGVKQEEEKQDQADYDEDQETGEISETTEKDEEQKPEKLNNNNLSESDNNPKTPSTDDGDVASTNQNEQQTDPPQNEQQQKTLKKPDKILPCPRCNSMDTKFCYYNNYNINQPRHFCKSCQRYWTAGGTMRNVPVGAGRRKNKNSGSHCRHITISEALQAARIDPSPNGFHHMKFKPNGTVLSFGPDSSPLCDSLNLAEKGALDGRNGFYKIENRGSICKNGLENVGDRQKPVIQNAQNGLQSPVPCIPGVPWSFPWNPTVPIPAVYPMPYYPAPYAWNMPWLTVPFPNHNQKSNPGSPLGKHSRNGELITPNRSEEREEHKNSDSSIVVPKTLRIDDPEEAAKSSIWATLGIKYGSISREGLFKALQPKADEKKQMVNTSPLLQANPAALSRSISFRERA